MELSEELNLVLETPCFSSSKLSDLPTHHHLGEVLGRGIGGNNFVMKQEDQKIALLHFESVAEVVFSILQ